MNPEDNLPPEVLKRAAEIQEARKPIGERRWRTNCEDDPFFAHKHRVEVEYQDGKRDTIIHPPSAAGLFSKVKLWRSAALPIAPSSRHQPSQAAGVSQAKVHHNKAVYRGLIKFHWYRTFPWQQRLAILFGANLIVMVAVPTENDPGNTTPFCSGYLADTDNPTDQMELEMKMLLDKQAPKHPTAQ